MQRLKDRVAIITGGGTGIGKSIALAYAREGAHTVLVGRRQPLLDDVAKQVRATGRKALTIQADASKEPLVKDMVARATKEFGRVDIMVNNAGGAGVVKNTVDMSLAEFQEVWEQNMISTMLCTREVLKHMIPAKRGIIINFSSNAAKGGFPMRSHYSATKAAIIAYTASVAREVGKYNIRVSCIMPGPVMTEALMEGFAARAKALGVPTEQIVNERVGLSPMGRMPTSDECANLAIFLASDESSFETGQNYHITGGGITY